VSRILLVAEAAPSRDALAMAISSAPHTVLAVAPGELRIAAARDWAPDVIVMELAPDGAALPLRIGMLRDPSLADVPFVALGDNEDEARALGANAFVPPQTSSDLLVGLVGRISALRFPLPT
jgi:CheY-like chemotaxis protein